MLVRDSAPSQTARMLKRAIDDYGDQGRGDVADLLARFQEIDGTKAETLRRELHNATGEMLPYRLAPLGEGFREPTDEEKIAAAPQVPFGSAQGADRWAAGNMADALLGKGDYGDAVTHFQGEIGRNRGAAMPYLAAVHEIMGEKNPGLAAKFATQMQKAGLTAAAEKKSGGAGAGNVLSAPIPPTVTPGPIPPAKPGETDIVIPAPQPGPGQKPETTPFPVPIPPAPASTPTAEPAPQPAPQPQTPAETEPQPSPAPTPNPPGQPEPPKETGAEGGQTKPSQTSRPPVEGHVADKSIEEIEKEAEANGGWLNTQQDKDRGNETQCTALVKQATGLGQASEWRAGDKIKGQDDPPLKPGTAIATFNDKGMYGTKNGRHAAIFVGYMEKNGQKGMEVLEQSKDRKVERKFIPFSSSGKFIYQAGNYSVIKK